MLDAFEPNTLDLVPTDEIWEELKRRFSAVVLITLYEESECLRRRVFWNGIGGACTCIGMLEMSKIEILEDGTEREEGE